MGHKSFIGEFEQMVLLAILQRVPEAYAPAIAQHLESPAARSSRRRHLSAT